MRILYLANTAIPARTANSINIMKMCQAFVDLGHRVLLVTRNVPGVAEDIGDLFGFYGVEPRFKFRRLAVTGPGKPPLAIARLQLTWWLASFRPDLIYARNHSLRYRLETFRRPVVLEAHRLPSDFAAEFRSLQHSSRLARVVVVSNPLRVDFERTFNLSPEKIRVEHNGANCPASRTCFALQGERSQLDVGYVGSLQPGKGMSLIASLAPHCPQINFHVIGGPSDLVADWRNRLSDCCNVFLYGYLPHSKTDAPRLAMDVLLAPYQEMMTTSGGLEHTTDWLSPVKIFEYMACGKAILASNLPTIREVLTHGYDGWLCPPQDVDLWADALLRLSEDPALRAALGRQALRSFEEKHTWRQRATRILSRLP